MAREVILPTFHPGQVRIFRNRGPLNAVRCPRRWGKTKMMVTIAGDAAAKGRKAGIFAPEHKQLLEPFDELAWCLRDIKARANKNEGTIRTITGGVADFWQLTDNSLAGRGREYDVVLIDEAAFTKNGQMMDIWRRSITPTMATRKKPFVWVFSTPNGIDEENFFYKICHDPALRFVQHEANILENPEIETEWLETKRREEHPKVFEQEYEAKFVDWSGTAFFSDEKLLVDGLPVPFPPHCDQVFCVIDTAVKTGSENDGTAVSYWAASTLVGHPLICLDWDIVQIEGALLEHWIPSVFARCEELAKLCSARMGSLGAYIEDAQSGSILLQQCTMRGYQAEALPAELTSVGKDGRAMNASGPVWRGEVKWSEHAYRKVTTYKGTTRNHMVAQVYGFRVGDKEAAKRADDLLDCFCYGIAISLGNRDGIA